MPSLSPRYRAFVADHFAVLAVGLVVVAGASGYLALSSTTVDGTRTVERTTGTVTVDSTFRHGATVTNGSALYDRGDRLRNRSLYFTRATPELDGSYRVRYDSTTDGPATVSIALGVVRRSVDGRENPTVYWRQTDPVGGVTNATVRPGESVRVPFAVNVTSQERRIAAVERDIGASPGTTELLVVADVTLRAPDGDDTIVKSRTDRLVIEPRGNTFAVATPDESTATYELTETVTRPVHGSAVRTYGSLLLSLSALGTLALLVVGRRRDAFEVTSEERARAAHDRARSEFDEWISVGDVPTTERTTVRVDSLSGLVDVAIDSDRRVIEDEDRGRYLVVVDDVSYVYEPPDSPPS